MKMSTYSDASLIYYPSGYKAGKAYSLKPIPYLGSEKVVNGDFATDTDWTKETGWTISDGTANYSGGPSNRNIRQNIGITNGKTYKIQYEVTSIASGEVSCRFGGMSGISEITATSTGDYVGYITANSSANGELLIEDNNNNFIGSIDNVSVKEVIDDGDLTFTRASTATRVNSDGLIEGVRTNLALYSNDLSNAAWLKTFTTITSNAAISPDGTTNANKIVETTNNNLHRAGQGAISVTSGQVYTFSFYAKAAERYELELQRINTSGTVFNGISVTTADLILGTLSVGSNVTSSSINSVGDGWYRISLSLTAIATGSGGLNIGMQKDGNVSYLGDGTSGVYIYGFQAELSPSATDYIPTTTTAVSVGMLANVPRIDYTGGGCGKLLLEPQRTNIALRSEEFSNASSWVLANSGTITANTTISPDGTQTADTLNAGANSAQVQQHRTDTSGAVYTVSIWVKRITGTGNVFLRAVVNADTLIAVTSDWQRFTATVTSTTTTIRIGVKLATSGDAVAIWGGQVELGSYATSYIPTTTTAVTRLADTASKSGISSLINSTEGVLYINSAALADDGTNRYLSLSNASSSDFVYFRYSSISNTCYARVTVGSVTSMEITYSSITQIDLNKIALRWSLNNIDFFINGVKVGVKNIITGSVSSASTLDTLQLGFGGSTSYFYSNLQSLMVFPTALSDDDLTLLTGTLGETYFESYALMANYLNYTIQ
jgi:hypothetical protein